MSQDMRPVLLISILVFSLSALIACKKENEKVPDPNIEHQAIVNLLRTNYEQLPEQEISISLDNRVYAQYAMPTEKYTHGILGDGIEAEQLVVVRDGIFYEYILPGDYVFEDIRPRLYDVDGDHELEVITIRTNVSKGAGIAIYKIVGDHLVEYAHVPEIGTAYRWLNIAAIHDLNNDGIVELVWIETPHIGGTLKVAKINAGTLQVLAEKAQYSNHKIGERNLCLSVLTEQSNKKVLYVPNQSRNKIVGFAFENNEFQAIDAIDQLVDFSQTLGAQYSFENTIEEENNCIIVN
jgi:hypothetical protein